MEPAIFRCPFETKGIKDNSILVVTLFGNRAMRLRLMREAISSLRTNRALSSVRFVLPESVTANCSSFTLLQKRLLPYQVEYLAVLLDTGLARHLLHHPLSSRIFGFFQSRRQYHRIAAREFTRELLWYRSRWKSLQGFCGSIFAWAKANAKEGVRYPEMILGELIRNEKKYYTFRMDLATYAIYVDQTKMRNPDHNDALFCIIKSPLYPQSFGRYSPRAEIVVTRDVDVAMLSYEAKVQLRCQSNAVHAQHGIRINDPESYQVGLGYWNLDDETMR